MRALEGHINASGNFVTDKMRGGRGKIENEWGERERERETETETETQRQRQRQREEGRRSRNRREVR